MRQLPLILILAWLFSTNFAFAGSSPKSVYLGIISHGSDVTGIFGDSFIAIQNPGQAVNNATAYNYNVFVDSKDLIQRAIAFETPIRTSAEKTTVDALFKDYNIREGRFFLMFKLRMLSNEIETCKVKLEADMSKSYEYTYFSNRLTRIVEILNSCVSPERQIQLNTKTSFGILDIAMGEVSMKDLLDRFPLILIRDLEAHPLVERTLALDPSTQTEIRAWRTRLDLVEEIKTNCSWTDKTAEALKTSLALYSSTTNIKIIKSIRHLFDSCPIEETQERELLSKTEAISGLTSSQKIEFETTARLGESP
jgi:hypothetical protein